MIEGRLYKLRIQILIMNMAQIKIYKDINIQRMLLRPRLGQKLDILPIMKTLLTIAINKKKKN